MGGPGHVVAPSKQANYGFMGVLMPLYTIGFVIFFAYTVMKVGLHRRVYEMSKSNQKFVIVGVQKEAGKPLGSSPLPTL